MRAQHPSFLRRLWWQSPLVARLVPALALIAATGAGVAANLPATPEQPHAHRPPQQVTNLAPPTTTAPPPVALPPAPPTTTEPPTTTSPPTRSTPRTTSKTTTASPPPESTTPTPSATSQSTPQRPQQQVVEGQSCDEPGDVGRGENGDRYVCDYQDGTWRWREW